MITVAKTSVIIEEKKVALFPPMISSQNQNKKTAPSEKSGKLS